VQHSPKIRKAELKEAQREMAIGMIHMDLPPMRYSSLLALLLNAW